MRPTPTAASSLLLTTLLLLGGCGSGATKTVSVSGRAESSSAVATASGSHSTAAPSTGKTEPTRTGTAQSARTTAAPAFVKEASGGGEGLEQAVAAVKAHGYTPADTSQYHPNQTLRVLVAARTGSADGYAQQAFFFVDGRYIGTDASTPSAGIELVSQGDTEATLAYRLYRPGDPLCCARGGQTTVRFQLDNGRLVALDPIPPVDSSTGAGRR